MAGTFSIALAKPIEVKVFLRGAKKAERLLGQ
jgi:hypothetical protein